MLYDPEVLIHCEQIDSYCRLYFQNSFWIVDI